MNVGTTPVLPLRRAFRRVGREGATEADLEAVPFEEAMARLARGIIATGSKYKALSGDGVTRTDAYSEVEVEVIEPVGALFRYDDDVVGHTHHFSSGPVEGTVNRVERVD